jgi:hypothetical protein
MEEGSLGRFVQREHCYELMFVEFAALRSTAEPAGESSMCFFEQAELSGYGQRCHHTYMGRPLVGVTMKRAPSTLRDIADKAAP